MAFVDSHTILEQRIESQALTTPLKTALAACLMGRESRRWTLAELEERLSSLGMSCSRSNIVGALAELELEFNLCSWMPWTLTERGAEWCLVAKSEFLENLSGVRALAPSCCSHLSENHKAVLLVVIGHRQKGGVSKTRIGEILQFDAGSYLDELLKIKLVYLDPNRTIHYWRPTSEALLALGLRSSSEIPALRELEQWFEAQAAVADAKRAKSSVEPILNKIEKVAARKRAREIARRATVPLSNEPHAIGGNNGYSQTTPLG
jgi:hypothetical protein